jgi:arabinose-5-phosphate isomerase
MVKTINIAKNVIRIEADAVSDLVNRIGDAFTTAVEIIQSTTGRVVVVGMGKSGSIAKKIAATLSSTGTTSFFVHPAEAFHGDLGMIHADDVILMISYSGETEELVRLLPFIKYQGNKIIAITGQLNSSIARNAHAVLDASVAREACSNNLAPTTSTTVALVLGDALAVTLSTLKNFQEEDFARFHPGGNLGRRLLTKVRDVMHKRPLPTCAPGMTLREVVSIMTRGKLGLALVMDQNRMLGIVTDGDLRRALESSSDPLNRTALEFMTENPHTISEDENLAIAEDKMKSLAKRMLVVVDAAQDPVGVLQIFDVEC